LLLMAGTLSLIFTGRPRLLPLAVALLAAALTFAALSLAGGSLAMAQVAVLPVLVGLAVDYAIQFQARVHEASPPGGERPQAEAIRAAAARGGPTLATAAAASAGAMLVLLLSPVPMVRGFGVLLVVGLGIALLCALTAGAAGLALVGASSPSRPAGRGAGSTPRRGWRRTAPSSCRRASARCRTWARSSVPPAWAARST